MTKAIVSWRNIGKTSHFPIEDWRLPHHHPWRIGQYYSRKTMIASLPICAVTIPLKRKSRLLGPLTFCILSILVRERALGRNTHPLPFSTYQRDPSHLFIGFKLFDLRMHVFVMGFLRWSWNLMDVYIAQRARIENILRKCLTWTTALMYKICT